MAMNQIEFIGLKSEDNPTLKAFQLGTIASKEAKAKVGSKEIDLRFTSVPLKDNQGNVVAAFEMFVDETEIKQAMRRNEKLTLYQEKQTEKIVQALEQLSSGNIDFEIHLDEPDEDTKDAYDRFMQIVNALNITSNTIAALSGDANMLANAALEGRLDVRADASKHKGAYRKIIEGMNGALDNLIKPLNVAAEYVDRIAKGDIPPKITDEYKGDFNEIKNNLNQLIDNVNNLYQELGVLINAIGVGNLSVRGDLSKFRGVWNEIINSVNEIMLQVETPIQEVLEVLKRIAVNDFKNKITKNFQGIWDELKKNTNLTIERFDSTVEAVKKISLGNLEQLPEIKAIGKRCAADEMVPAFIKLMEALEAMAEDVRMLTESAIEGNLSVRADASKHYGIYKEIVNGFNETLDAVIAPVEEAGEVLNTMATGDLTVKVKGNYKGDHKKLQESINTLVDSFNDLIGRL
ncbi:MAG TPA: hypothetical protein PK007_05630 [Candidatus Kapabacteria bacterium]|nr:hypothetical protein [Candidatus Kapabacteria bacterium]